MDKIEWYVDPKDESLHMVAHKTSPDGVPQNVYLTVTKWEMLNSDISKLIELKLGQLWKEMGYGN